jgi:ParB/RepB/Spo0J family partition protein
METLATKRGDLMSVSPNNIVVEEEFNVRIDYGDLEGLMNSIIANGQIEPVLGYKIQGSEQYVLTDGHRRFKAIQMAIEKGHEIPYVKLIKTSSNAEDRLFQMVITGVDKKPLTPLEEAETYKRLVALGYEPKEIASRVGKSLPHVYNGLKLAEAPKKIKNAIQNGSISATTVTQIIREVGEGEDVVEIIETAITNAQVLPNGKVKKVTKKQVQKVAQKKGAVKDKTLSPMQKLSAAYDQMKGDEVYYEMLGEVVALLQNKETSVNDIVDVFSTEV